jgi:hypothetical protein
MGWSLRVKRKAEPSSGSRRPKCHGVFILGGKATGVAQQSRLPQRVLKALDEAPVSGEPVSVSK